MSDGDYKEYVDARNLIVTVTDAKGPSGHPEGFTLFDIIEFHARDNGYSLDEAFTLAENVTTSLTIDEATARMLGFGFQYS